MVSDIRIERVLKAQLEDVYAAWTRVELLAQWYCPNPELELKVDADVRVGGAYVVEMGPYVVRGSYLEVDPPHVLAFTWKWDEDTDEPSPPQGFPVARSRAPGAGARLPAGSDLGPSVVGSVNPAPTLPGILPLRC